MSANQQHSHDHKVGSYFDKASVTFDTFYDNKRSVFMQWVDKRFRSDVFERYYRTFEILQPFSGKTVIDIGCGSGPYVVEAIKLGSKRVVGFDLSQGMLDLASERAQKAGVRDKCEFLLYPMNYLTILLPWE